MKHLKEFLERLEENIPEGLDWQTLIEEFGGSLDNLVARCQTETGEHLIYTKGGERWHISDRGILHLEKLRNQEIQKEQNKLQEKNITISKKQNRALYAQAAVTLFLIIATIILGNKANTIAEAQANISRIQTEIIQRANPSFEPYIEIVPDFDDLEVFAPYIADKRYLEEENPKRRWARIGLTIYNFGKMDSQNIYCDGKSGNKHLYGYITTDISNSTDNIKNLPAGTSTRGNLHIKYWYCQPDNTEDCRSELVPKGLQNITFECSCRGCKTQHKFEVPIQYCIYYKNKILECPDGILN